MGIFRVIPIVLALPLTGAEFIIDDFDDSVQVSSPEMRLEYVITENAGPLGLKRLVTWGGPFQMVAHADANITLPSNYTATMVALNPMSVAPVGGANIRYENIGGMDFTQGGQNDTLFLDFTAITGPTPPAFFRPRFWDVAHPGDSFIAVIEPNGSLTLAMPFTAFRSRGGEPVYADFSGIQQLEIDIIGNGYYGAPEELGWTIQIDRIRVGKTPEPSAMCLAVVGLLVMCGYFRAKGKDHEKEWSSVDRRARHQHAESCD